MTQTEIKRMLIQTRIAQMNYTLFAEKLRHYDLMTGGSDTISAEYLKKLAELEKAMMETRRKTDALIDGLTVQSEREIITRRYLICQTWEQIADIMNYSVRQVTRIHHKALAKMSLNVQQKL